MRPEHEIETAIENHGDMIYRIGFLYMKSHSDVEDIFQKVFLKYALYEHVFNSDEYEKAWLIRVAVNLCKDELKRFFRSKVVSIEKIGTDPPVVQNEHTEVLEAIKKLPKNYRLVIYMFYYEGYSAVEIAEITGKKTNTIYTWLDRGRKSLRAELGGNIVEG